MQAYICTLCGFLYDEESAEKTPENKLIPFEELDFDWICPTCGLKGTLFQTTYSTRTKDIPVDNNTPRVAGGAKETKRTKDVPVEEDQEKNSSTPRNTVGTSETKKTQKIKK